MPNAVIYTRISSDRSDTRLGVARQEKLCRALCKTAGHAIVDVLTDNDVSAVSRDRLSGSDPFRSCSLRSLHSHCGADRRL